MKTAILYHPNSEFAGVSEDFRREFETRHPDHRVELISLETKEGSETAQLYDVVRYPAILVIDNDGRMQKLWQDQPFPLIDEVYAYMAGGRS